jgi:serine/threonine-protein kinase
VTPHTLQIMVGGRIPVAIGPVAEVELLDLLGSGGFASAWRTRDIASGAEYTLKIIQGLLPGSVMAERVRLEAEVSIPSDYILPVVGLRQWDPSTFLILFPFFPGQSLEGLLEKGGLTGEQKKNIYRQVLQAVSDAHRHNVIHRDLKPGNILVNEAGAVRLIDFGISKFKGGKLTISGEIIGTLPYMAPELILLGAKVADARADIYSLGQILYELGMGQHFWTRQGWRELKDLVGFLSRKPEPTELIDLADFHCDFYSTAADVLPRMVKTRPEERYESVDDVQIGLGYVPHLPEPPRDLHLRSPLLIVESGSNRGARTVLGLADGERRELGRSDIAGNDESISRRHVEFSRSSDTYYVRDLGSKNGTMVRGLALDGETPRMEIRHADRVKVGEVFLRFAFLREA